jgi:YD repeat-containing protein
VSTLISSGLEHAVLEQTMGSDNPGISTIRMLQINNNGGDKIFLADQSNFASIETQLQNYNPGTIGQLQYDVNNGRTLVLPQNGALGLNQWSGTGYITKKFDADSGSIGMIISGGYSGGYVSIEGDVLSNYVESSAYHSIWTIPNSDTSYFSNWTIDTNWGCDPVEMAGGNFVHNHTDLALGGNAPRGLSFSRSYNSRMNLKKRSLGYGWTHNYDIYLEEHSHGDPVLGNRQPVDAAALITKLYITLDLLRTDTTDELLKWTVSSIASKWAVDRMIDNAVTVHMGNNLMEFVKLPDGSYSPPPGVTTKLINNGDNTFSLEERFGTTMDFDTGNRITQMTDIDDNTLTFTYDTDGLKTVQDTFGRTITLNYTSGKIDSVDDSTGRSVSYSYTVDDLTGYTDAEGKPWTFAYTDANHPHRMTDLANPFIITATNIYDSLGRVKTQTSPKQTGSSTYKFYFSGFRNALEDPDGDQEIYYYDEKGRPVATEDQLDNKSYKEYDGQSHVVKTIDPRGNETGFTYDGNHNLIQATNALTHSTHLKYDVEAVLLMMLNTILLIQK